QDVVQVSLVYDATGGKRFDNKNEEPADALLSSLRGMSKLRTLLLQGDQATDDGLKRIGAITSLEELYIWNGRQVTDAGVAHLKNLKRLKIIHLEGSQVTDVGLAELAQLPTLENMSLQNNRFTDHGLARLRGMTTLKKLYVGMSQGEITDAGMASLAGLP